MADTLDLVQGRYGWTDEYVLSLPYARFTQLVNQAIKSKEEKRRELCFLGWQIRSALADSKSFNEYYNSLFSKNDEDSPNSKEEMKKIDKKTALNKANDILSKFQNK